MSRSSSILLPALCCLIGSVALVPRTVAAPASAGQLGTVNFPTSCSASAQPKMTTGLAYLHSFQYSQAADTFKNAAEADPHCAMAHWGQAMSLYHQLWDFPQPDTLAEGLKHVEEAEKIGAATDRERGYIAAAAAFYQNDAKLTHLQRLQAYSAATAKLHKQFPDDVEAAAFYALSEVALAYEDDDNDAAHRTAAIAILEPLLKTNPDNPGVAHYMIHATDSPKFASQGLVAARSYAKIAPDSSHAIHMPSHIFVDLGLWQESIDSNIAASASAAHATEMHHADAHYQTHAMDFLNYSYLQSGQEAKARAVSAATQNVAGATAEDKSEFAAAFSARDAMELHRWKDAAALSIPKIKLQWQGSTYWARTIGAARSGDPSSAHANLDKLRDVVAAREKFQKEQGYVVPDRKATDLAEAEAWTLFADGKHDEALKELRAAADRQDKEADYPLGIPARELLADMLLELKQPANALAEYRTALKNSPNRFDSVYGAALAAKDSGDAKSAHEYEAKLVEISAPGADRPELATVRTLLAKQ